MDTRDIVEQLQDACDLATDKRELERLCGNAKAEIERLRAIEVAAVAAVDFDQWQGDEWYELMMELQKALSGSHEAACQNCDGTGDEMAANGPEQGQRGAQCECGGYTTWCAQCRVWSRTCCVEYGTCQCS